MEPRAIRSSGSRIPVGVKSGGERRRQELKHSVGGTNKENFEAKTEVKKLEKHTHDDSEVEEIKKEDLELKSGNRVDFLAFLESKQFDEENEC